MTANQRYLIKMLLKGDHYLVKTVNYHGVDMYKLYQGNQNPVRYIHRKTVKTLSSFFKTSKKGKITLNLNRVRQEHGKSLIKQYYKNSKTQSNGTRSNKP